MQWKKPGKPNPFLLRHFNVNMKIHICFTIAEDETTAIIVLWVAMMATIDLKQLMSILIFQQ